MPFMKDMGDNIGNFSVIDNFCEENQVKIQKYLNFLLFLKIEIKDIIFNKNHDCHPIYQML